LVATASRSTISTTAYWLSCDTPPTASPSLVAIANDNFCADTGPYPGRGKKKLPLNESIFNYRLVVFI